MQQSIRVRIKLPSTGDTGCSETISAKNSAKVLERKSNPRKKKQIPQVWRFGETTRKSAGLLEKVVLNRESPYTKNVATWISCLRPIPSEQPERRSNPLPPSHILSFDFFTSFHIKDSTWVSSILPITIAKEWASNQSSLKLASQQTFFNNRFYVSS